MDKQEKQYFPGDPLFVKIGDQGSRLLRTVHDLAGMNQAFEKAEKTVDGRDTKIDDLKKDWKFYGIYRNKTNVQNQGFAMGESYHRDELDIGRHQQELINVDVFGRSKIVNFFGKVQRGDHLGLALFEYQDTTDGIRPIGVADGVAQRKTRYFPTKNGEVIKTKLNNGKGMQVGSILASIPLGICSFSTREYKFKEENVTRRVNIADKHQLEILML
jgi:hypothetical protein